MEPSQLYNHSKRNLAVFTAVFALVLLGSVRPEEGAKFLGFSLSPEAIPTVLFFVVIYLLYQFFLARVFQHDAVRMGPLIQVDFWLLFICASATLVTYLLWYLPKFLGLGANVHIGIAVAILVACAASYIALRSSDTAKLLRDLRLLRKSTIEERLLEPGWVLNFRPRDPNGSKKISFNEDGSIGEGRNTNEHQWKLDGDVLVVKRENGDLQNKFKYDATADQFVRIDDPLSKGFKGQFIFRPT